MYKHILFATDFSPESKLAEAKAVKLAQLCNALLSVVHVIDYYPNASLGGVDGPLAQYPDLKSETNKQIKQVMESCVTRIPMELCTHRVLEGSPKNVIVEFSEEIAADLIVLGSHGRHGLGLLLGSTASGVLHKAKCDVLAVRVFD